MKRRLLLATAASAALAGRGAWAADQASVVPVLTYHRFEAKANSGTIVTPAVFAAQMQYLVDQNIEVAKLRDVLAVAHGERLTRPTVAITADDGWRSVYTEMFPVIKHHGFPVTLFINPPMIGHGSAYLTWTMITELQQSGLFDIQAHSMNHPNFNTERAKRPAEAYADFVHRQLADCIPIIAEHTGTAPDLLAWPFGIHDATLEQAAADAGYKAAFALGSRPMANSAPDFALPRLQIYDTDTPKRFAWIAAGNPRQPVMKVAS